MKKIPTVTKVKCSEKLTAYTYSESAYTRALQCAYLSLNFREAELPWLKQSSSTQRRSSTRYTPLLRSCPVHLLVAMIDLFVYDVFNSSSAAAATGHHPTSNQ